MKFLSFEGLGSGSGSGSGSSGGVSSWNDLTDKPTLFSGDYNSLSNLPTLFSGEYSDLVNAPTLFSGSYSDLSDKPTLFSGSYNDLVDAPDNTAVASGSTLGLEQELLAQAGQVGKNVLAVGYTNTGKVQGVSLGDGNVVTVYASGADFADGTVLYREFMKLGEPICFTGLSNGAIIQASEGFYGASEIDFGGTLLATMPLLSLGLSFTDTFLFSFRQSNRSSQNHAFIFFVNGPLENTVEVVYGNGNAIPDQPAFVLDPWAFGVVHLDGDSEYRIKCTTKVMACTACGFNNSDYTSASTPISAGPRDARLILPVSNDVITHPRSGFVSALFENTVIEWYDVAGDEGFFNGGAGIGPGSPQDTAIATTSGGTGNSTTDYRPNGFSRYKASGLISAYSGADGAGGDATPACPVTAMSQVVAQPLFINDAGNGDQTSVTIASPYEGTAKVYAWNDATGVAELAYTVPLSRQGVTVSAPDDQYHPTAGQVSNEPDAGVVTLIGQLNPGYVIADVPIMVVSQSNGTPTATLRSQNGTTTTSMKNDDDETLMFGITPDDLRAEIRKDAGGLLRRRDIDATGTETWTVC